MVKNLTEGKPSIVLWKFTLPLLLSLVFQQLYNIIDSIVAGKYAGAMKFFMATTFTDLILRVILAFVFSAFFDAAGIWMSWPFGWSISAIMSIAFYIAGVWKLPSVAKRS